MKTRHKPIDLIITTIRAVICGAEDRIETEEGRLGVGFLVYQATITYHETKAWSHGGGSINQEHGSYVDDAYDGQGYG
jgi:hypothetical protein